MTYYENAALLRKKMEVGMSISSEQLGQVYFESPGVVTSVCANSSHLMVGFRLPEEWARVHDGHNIYMEQETLEEYLEARGEHLRDRGDDPRTDFSYREARKVLIKFEQTKAQLRDTGDAGLSEPGFL